MLPGESWASCDGLRCTTAAAATAGDVDVGFEPLDLLAAIL
jgi:hypothetical protein